VLCRGGALLATAAGVMVIILIGASVVMRRLANAPFRFTEELVGLLVTAIVFLALPLVTLQARHVHVQIAVNALPAGTRRWVGRVAGVLGSLFCLWIVMLSVPWLEFAVDRMIRTEVSRLLLYPWMALLPISLLVTAGAFLASGCRHSGSAHALRPETGCGSRR